MELEEREYTTEENNIHSECRSISNKIKRYNTTDVDSSCITTLTRDIIFKYFEKVGDQENKNDENPPLYKNVNNY